MVIRENTVKMSEEKFFAIMQAIYLLYLPMITSESWVFTSGGSSSSTSSSSP